MSDVLKVKIGGQAGQGIKSSGLLFAKFASRSGFFVYNYTEFPSIIRGGHNVMQINVSKEKVTGPSLKTNVLIALNQETINKHSGELESPSGVVFDSDDKLDLSLVSAETIKYPVPLSKLAREAGGGDLLINTVALGSLVAVLGGKPEVLQDLLTEEYGDKGEAVVQENQKALELGHRYVIQNFPDHVLDSGVGLDSRFRENDNSAVDRSKIVLNGNEAVALGAIAGGMQFASIYPMSPITNILHVLAKHQEEFGYVYKQPEDEISAINMAIGAAFAGARSMVATSGGGFCLMSEAYGLAGMTETPIVIFEGMRGAPATGLPTWTEQGDLRFVLHAHQGEFPRIVLVAGDVEEAFYLARKAFNLAEKYQTPVLILLDKYICESHESVLPFDNNDFEIDRGNFSADKLNEKYMRYALAENGISQRTIPGTGNFIMANSDEHTQEGYSNEEAEMRIAQMNKRMQKLKTCEKEDMEKPILYGPKDAETTIVSWGSNKGPILESLKSLPNVNYLHLIWINPFPVDAVKEALQNSKHIINIECNYSAQMKGLIKEKTGIEIKEEVLRYDGRPFYPEDIVERVKGSTK